MPVPAPRAPARPARHDLIRRLGSSRFNYWFGYVANLALIGWLASHAQRGGRLILDPLPLALLAVGGLLVWTLAEYLLHRYVYHQLPSFLSVGHGMHHASPRATIGVPWWLTTVLVVAVFYLVSRLLDPAAAGVFLGACWLGYVLYCIAHHGSHRGRFRGRWLRGMRRRHLIHHAHPRYNLGFTTALWDRVFGTYWDRDPLP
jgi:sterol desaturase/sphingolipid hydroxylase (fatty acid hydroxylase superfamily)